MAENQELQVYDKPYKIESVDFARVMAAMSAATEGHVDIFKLPQLRVPSGGGLQWNVEGIFHSTLQGTIVHHHAMRSYWKESFGTRAAAPPDCQSLDGLLGYGDPGGRCVHPATRQPLCPHAEFGTKASASGGQGRAPACKNAHALYIEFPTSALPWVLMAPGVSINPVRDYIRTLAAQGFFPSDVVTEFSLKQAKNAEGITFSQLVLKAVALTSGALQQALERCATALRETIQGQRDFLREYSPALLPSASETPEQRAEAVQRVERSKAGLMFHDTPDTNDTNDTDDIADPPVPEHMTD